MRCILTALVMFFVATLSFAGSANPPAPQSAPALATTALAATSATSAKKETFKLEYKLQPGMELIYNTSQTIRQTAEGTGMEMEEMSCGRERVVATEVDSETGLMLISRAAASNVTVKAHGASFSNASREQTSETFSVCRLDRLGNATVRQVRNEHMGTQSVRIGMTLASLDRQPFLIVPLPAKAVAVGESFESTVSSEIPGTQMALPVKVISTLVEIKTIDGHECGVIRSKVTTGSKIPEAVFANAKKAPREASCQMEEEVETLFDLQGGFPRRVDSKSRYKYDIDGTAGLRMSDATIVLDSMSALPAAEATRERAAVHALDAAISAADGGEYEKAIAGLEAVGPTEVSEVWQSRIRKAVKIIKQIAQLAKGEQLSADAAQKLFTKAYQTEHGQKWSDAVAQYEELAQKYPDELLAATALSAAAHILRTNLNDKKSGDELLQQALAMYERQAAGDPMLLFRLARGCSQEGNPEKATEFYRQVLAVADGSVPPYFLVESQYEIAALLDKAGKKAAAIEAYKAVAGIPADDADSIELKDRPKKRVEALSVPPPKLERTVP